MYRKTEELNAIAADKSVWNVFFKECGLFIDKEYRFLCASPDNLVRTDKLVEINCPFSARRAQKLKEIGNLHTIAMKINESIKHN